MTHDHHGHDHDHGCAHVGGHGHVRGSVTLHVSLSVTLCECECAQSESWSSHCCCDCASHVCAHDCELQAEHHCHPAERFHFLSVTLFFTGTGTPQQQVWVLMLA